MPMIRSQTTIGRFRTALSATLLAQLTLTACARVAIHAGDGGVSLHNHAGVLSIDVEPGTTPQIIDLRGLGVFAQNGGMTLGYVSSSTAALPATDCRLVVWIDDVTAAPAQITALVDGRADVCAVGPGTAPRTTTGPVRPK